MLVREAQDRLRVLSVAGVEALLICAGAKSTILTPHLA